MKNAECKMQNEVQIILHFAFCIRCQREDTNDLGNCDEHTSFNAEPSTGNPIRAARSVGNAALQTAMKRKNEAAAEAAAA
jgi:hypothetical protein